MEGKSEQGQETGVEATGGESAGAMPDWFEKPPAGMVPAFLVVPPQGGEGAEGRSEDVASAGPELALEDVQQGEDGAQEAQEEGKPAAEEKTHFLNLPAPRNDRRAPAWAADKIPQGMRFPRGIEVLFVRIRAEVTHARHKGDRILIVWGLTDADEKLALGRSMADGNRAAVEMTKQMVRAIDGAQVDWSGRPGSGNIEQLWREIGGKGRGQLTRLYTQLHVYDREEQRDFFENCVAVVPTG